MSVRIILGLTVRLPVVLLGALLAGLAELDGLLHGVHDHGVLVLEGNDASEIEKNIITLFNNDFVSYIHFFSL